MKKTEEITDITIIGCGPTGLFTAFYAGLRQASVKIIESLPELGGQLTALYPEKFIYDIAGFPKISGQELIENLMKQMKHFEQTICTGEAVQEIKRTKENSLKITTNQAVHYTKTIIITAGGGAFTPRKLNIENAQKFENQNLHYAISDMHYFTGKEVMILGGGDSAVDWALMLEPIAKKVTLVHRRDKFRAHEYSVKLLKNSSVNVKTPYVPVKLIGENQIEEVELKETRGPHIKSMKTDEVLVHYGFSSSLGSITQWGLDIDKNSIVVNSRMETNIPGVYAIGDICTYEGKVK